MTTASLLGLALAAIATGIVAGPRLGRTWLALNLLAAGSALGAGLSVLLGRTEFEWRSRFAIGGEEVHARLDGVSALFLVLMAVVGGAGAAYSRGYWSDRDRPTSAGRARAWWSGLLLSMGLVLTASNGLHFLIAWEAFTVCSYFLITLDRRPAGVRAAGRLYLTASHSATVFLFAFFAILCARTGGWDLHPMRERTDLAPLFWLVLVGFGVKAGVFPLHVWLPSAHAGAPSHVSALMSGVAIKMGVYGLVRFSGWLPVPPEAGGTVLGLGAVGAVLGIAFALAQTDLKRVLAYCSVENVGIILVGFGGALIARSEGSAAWGRLALTGALLHVWNHGAFKALLFFGAGSVLHATGTREMSRMGGLWTRMPFTAGLFTVGCVAVAGLPPLNGVVSEWMVSLGLLDAAVGVDAPAWAAVPALIALACAAALALATFVKAGSTIFLGAPRTKAARTAHECGGFMRGPMIALAGACLAMGLAPALLWPAVSRAVGAWNPAWASAPVPAPLRTIGAVHLVLAALAVAAAVLLRLRAKATGLTRGPTWDCGYAAPSARMQYTGGSFGGLASGWFAWVLRPELRLRRPRGPFPTGAIRLERVPETVLERWIGPVAEALLRVSTAVRRLQHGRIQAYVLYVVVGLICLGSMVALGGTP